MNRIFDFEQQPPVLTEAMLRQRLEARTLRRQTWILACGGLLFQLCILLTGLLLYPLSPLISLLSVVYAIGSVFGTGILAIVFRKQRRYLTQ